MRSSVDLPHPDGPTIVTNSPGATSNVVDPSANVPSGNVLDTSVKARAAARVVGCCRLGRHAAPQCIIIPPVTLNAWPVQ